VRNASSHFNKDHASEKSDKVQRVSCTRPCTSMMQISHHVQGDLEATFRNTLTVDQCTGGLSRAAETAADGLPKVRAYLVCVEPSFF
ncbi:hypothetical protein CEXT_141611, partial [Caerostris extrusa]